MTKCDWGVPSRTLDRNPRIEAYDSAGTDEGVRIVTLVPGFAFEDAAENEGDDPDARNALHSKAFSTVKAAVEGVRYARPCKCGRCLTSRRKDR